MTSFKNFQRIQQNETSKDKLIYYELYYYCIIKTVLLRVPIFKECHVEFTTVSGQYCERYCNFILESNLFSK